MKKDVYVVYDANDRIVSIYANWTWAKKYADRSSSYRIERYVHTKYAEEVSGYKYF